MENLATPDLSIEQEQEPSYPPAPWRLNGQLYGSIWTVPRAAFQVELPPQFKPIINFNRIGVYAGFVDYQAGSVLTYHELIAGVVVRLAGNWRIAFNVTHIWVDDRASRRGGRELWGVPKELAQFEYHYARANHNLQGTARDGAQTLAEGNFHSVAGLPGGWRIPVPFPDLQILNARPHSSSGTFWSSLQVCRGGMDIPTDSPLARLGIAGRKPLVSFAGLDFKMHLAAARPVNSRRG